MVFDTETTGTDPKQDQAVSLGAISVVSGRLVLGDTFDRTMAAAVAATRSAIVVHGLTPDKVAKGAPPYQVLEEFLLWAGDAVLVAHHASFDLAMLDRVLNARREICIQNLVLDTARLARRVERRADLPYDLDSLLSRYRIPLTVGRHTALGDAVLTARLLQKMLKKLSARGVDTLADLTGPGPLLPLGPG